MTSQQRGRDRKKIKRKKKKTQEVVSAIGVCKLTEMLNSVRESSKSGTPLNIKFWSKT